MICALLNREVQRICRSALRFLDVSVSRAMGCFFGCFRVKDERPRISHFACAKYAEPVVSRNRLSTLFLSEEKEGSWSSDRGNQRLGSPQIEKGLKDEAKFLKACGTLPETPAEIRKASEKLKGSAIHDKDSEASKFRSWLPNTSIKKLQLEKQCDQPPTPVKLSEERGRGSPSSPSSCISNVQNTGRISISSIEGSDAGSGSADAAVKMEVNQFDNNTSFALPQVSGSNVHCKNKSVRFECDFDSSASNGSSSGHTGQNLKKYESPGNESVSKPSPNPTPLKLFDDVQTPGTVFPANLESLTNGNNRIRSQYVYTVQNPVENASQWKALKADDHESHQLSSELGESLEQSEHATPYSKVGIKETSVGNDLNVEASLSAWFKPVSIGDDGSKYIGGASSRKSYFGKTPGDRPIIGMVAAHWNEVETTQITPKWWDGNGIPNSTNKYKEDQKVSWHATPFEERLEKALSEESLISQRDQIDQTRKVLDETGESDTALSQLRPSSHSKSVVSY